MSSPPPFPLRVTCARLDWQDDTPVARDFGDVYFSRGAGIAETRHVFIDGNDLPARFAASDSFTIAETGFGSGLNFLVAATEFLRRAPADAVLHYVSVEKFPLTAADLARAQAHWPELAPLAAELQAGYPPPVAGFHYRVLAGGRIRLTLLLGDAAELLPCLQARIDAWFLDGFAPAKNTDLWTPALFARMAQLSAPGASFATFTAAGHVRRALIAAGFAVEKVRGHGHKRDMLRGHCNVATPATRRKSGHAAVIGGGLAGCAAARALAERGWQVTLFERNATLAAETSGNLAGAVYPKFSVHETAQNRWYRDSYFFALARLPQVLGTPDNRHWSQCGLLQLAMTPAQEDALQAVAGSARWPASVLRHAGREETAALTGLSLDRDGLWFAGAGWVHPPALCRALVDHPRIEPRCGHTVRTLVAGDDGVQVDGARFDTVVIANALAAKEFVPELPLRRVRGQVTHVDATPASAALHAVVCHEGYVTPARTGLHSIGATFGPRGAVPAVRDSDHAENLQNLATALPTLHAALGGNAAHIAGGRTGFRVQSPDYLPLLGAVPGTAGVHILAALGAKGIAFSLLGAELVAARIAGEPLPVDSGVAAALDPERFALRAARRSAKVGRASSRPPGDPS